MLDREPVIRVGLLDRKSEIRGRLDGAFDVTAGPAAVTAVRGEFRARNVKGEIVLSGDFGDLRAGRECALAPHADSLFVLFGITIGSGFHWERDEGQTFRGVLLISAGRGGAICAVNEVPLEDYLESVVASEMSADAPFEFIKAHAIISRSWLAAMLDRRTRPQLQPPGFVSEQEIVRWYGREEHDRFDVCADDHCQRYHGIAGAVNEQARKAAEETRGVFLVYEDDICDARFYKACGGRTECFQNAWEDSPVPYLISVSDAETEYPPVETEKYAEEWVLSRPEAFCNTSDPEFLRKILPSFDRETEDFFRWKVVYGREELEHIIRGKSGMDFGTIMDIVAMTRGPSGRITRLRIEGTRAAITVGKELEIRRWLSPSHLYSSAFIIRTERDERGIPDRFVLYGAGWGHGVGLCQIGAAVMASRGFKVEEILQHYYKGAELKKLY